MLLSLARCFLALLSICDVYSIMGCFPCDFERCAISNWLFVHCDVLKDAFERSAMFTGALEG